MIIIDDETVVTSGWDNLLIAALYAKVRQYLSKDGMRISSKNSAPGNHVVGEQFPDIGHTIDLKRNLNMKMLDKWAKIAVTTAKIGECDTIKFSAWRSLLERLSWFAAFFIGLLAGFNEVNKNFKGFERKLIASAPPRIDPKVKTEGVKRRAERYRHFSTAFEHCSVYKKQKKSPRVDASVTSGDIKYTR